MPSKLIMFDYNTKFFRFISVEKNCDNENKYDY